MGVRVAFVVLACIALVTVVTGAATTLHAAAQQTGRYFGTAVGAEGVNNAQINPIWKSEFGVTTCVNEMKLDATEGQKGVFSFSRGDSIMNKALSYGHFMRGHCLAWHSQQPQWWQGISGQTLRDAMISHIQGVLKYYKGKIPIWDVVNEAYADGGGSGRRSSNLQNTGNDWIEVAFKTAREADPSAVLCYNDYNIDNINDGKTKGVLAMVKDFKSRNIPIDCVGLQAHFTGGSSVPGNYQSTLQAFADLGVIVQITELDITNANGNAYGSATKACMDTERCQGITTWGIGDPDSWRRSESCLIWDSSYQKKGCYQNVLSALNAATKPFVPPAGTPWAGGNGTTPVDKCASVKCANGGTCVSTDGSCKCATGFTGATCATATDPCASIKCSNGGTCSAGKCTCATGYSGTTCDTVTPVDACATLKCQNGGTCANGKCTCATGFSGTTCGTAANLCATVDCQNGGTCSKTTGKCTCAEGFSGDLCETDDNGGGDLGDPCENVKCSNGGTCANGKCFCATGFTGTTCTVTDCTGKCLNGGTCSKTTGKCTCVNNYSGATCNVKPGGNACSGNPCEGGTCTVSGTSYTCTCGVGYTVAEDELSCVQTINQKQDNSGSSSVSSALVVMLVIAGILLIVLVVLVVRCVNNPERLAQFKQRFSRAAPTDTSYYGQQQQQTNAYYGGQPPAPPQGQYRPQP